MFFTVNLLIRNLRGHVRGNGGRFFIYGVGHVDLLVTDSYKSHAPAED